ncbi:MAG: TIGR04255 family protein [Stellaceae bacterium]
MISINLPILQEEGMPLLPRPADLPDFERPPINEVVLSIQFASIPAFRSVHIGLLWDKFRQEYPKVSERPPLPAAFETFGGMPVNPAPLFQIEALTAPPMSRFWFEEEEGAEIIQIQQDRIVHNWRKRETEQRYPRYETIRQRFASDLERFGAFLASEHLGELRPNQCEVTYINLIEIPGDDDIHRHLARITPLWAGRFSESCSFELESAGIQTRFVLREDGKPFGRVYVNCTPAVLIAQNRPGIRLDIIARGKPRDESIAEALRLLDTEREVVVRTFAAVTTPEMWEIWGRIWGGRNGE